MADYVGSDKLVSSEYLYRQFQNFDGHRAKKLKDSLFVPEHYVFNDVDGALTIVDDGLATLDTEVEISVVNSKLLEDDVHVYQIGEKVDLIPEAEIYLKSNNAYTKDEIDEKLEEAGGTTTEEIKVYGVCADLGYSEGDVIPQGTSFNDILKKLLQKVIHPTYIKPTMTLTASTTLVEKGVTTDVTLTSVFTKNDAGAINGYKVYRDGAEIESQTTTSVASYTDSGNVFNDVTTYKYEISYDEGTDKLNNVNELDPVGKILAGSIFKEVKVEPVDATYVGVVANGTAIDGTTITGLEKLIRKNTNYTKKFTANFESIVFVTTGSLTSIINANNYEVLSAFTKTTATINSVSYNVYTLANVNVSDFGYTFKY